MNIYDAAKILGLTSEITPKETKKAFREACKKYHPDVNPAGEEMMKIINEAYETLKEYQGEIKHEHVEYGDAMNDALNAIINLQGLIIEICGAWLWVTGNTRDHKAALKDANFKWAFKKKAWYFRPEDYRSKSKGSKSLDDIRNKYGSQRPDQPNNRIKERSE